MAKGYGDRLARGTAKAVFPASEGASQEQFEKAVADFDPQAYIQKAEAAEAEARERRAQRIETEAAEAVQRDVEREQRRAAEAALEVEETAQTPRY